MAGYRKRNTEGPSSEDKALDLFAEMMIEKIESIHKDWHKPWFTEGALQWPRNLSGREYNGMNALMLLLHCENEGYKIPRFCTFDCVQRLNKPGKDGQELPRVSVLRGEKSFPVMLTTFTCIHKETKEKIKYDDYKKLSDEEKAQYNVYPKMQVFRVSMSPRPTCRRLDRSYGSSWKERTGKGSKTANISVWACRCDDKGQPLDLSHQTDAPKRSILLNHKERDCRTRKGAVQRRGIFLRNAVP